MAAELVKLYFGFFKACTKKVGAVLGGVGEERGDICRGLWGVGEEIGVFVVVGLSILFIYCLIF